MKTMENARIADLLGAVPEVDREVVAVAHDACAHLGYTRLQLEVAPKQYPLLRALNSLEVTPLDPVAVERYKARKVSLEVWRDTIKSGYTWIFAVLIMLAGGVFFGMLIGGIVGPENNLAWITCQSMTPIGLVVGFFAGMCIGKSIQGDRFDWDSTPLPQYRLPVPEFVLRKGVAISKQMKGHANFYVESIRGKPMADPFLVVELGAERYYVEVWDEPKFEAKL